VVLNIIACSKNAREHRLRVGLISAVARCTVVLNGIVAQFLCARRIGHVGNAHLRSITMMATYTEHGLAPYGAPPVNAAERRGGYGTPLCDLDAQRSFS
jgi:hypothetical protein